MGLGAVIRLLPQHLLEQIAAEVPPNRNAGSDIPNWRLEDRRIFTTKSAYEQLRESTLGTRVSKDAIHVLRDCIVAQDLLANVLPRDHLTNFFQPHFDE
ncbi:hypothetical protein V6N13_115414 [Hibiscus sabdariffa]